VRTLLLTAALLAAAPSLAQPMMRAGWVVADSDKTYPDLIAAVRQAAQANGLGVVTEAGPTEVAANRGIDIPGNRVIGLFNNDFAVRVLGLSTAAMIEAPIRVYVTEDADGTATLSYKTPSHVFAPYLDEGGAALRAIAGDLDALFARVAAAAVE